MSKVKSYASCHNEILTDEDIICRAEAGATIDSIVNLFVKKEGTQRRETRNRVELVLYQHSNSEKQNKKID